MILGQVAFYLNVLTVGVLSLWLSLIFIGIILLLFHHGLTAFTASAKRRVLWFVILMPWLVAVMATFALMMPARLDPHANGFIATLVHWHHAYTFNLTSWHGLTMALFSSVFIFGVFRRAFHVRKSLHRLDLLAHFSTSDEQTVGFSEGNRFSTIESSLPQAFTTGLFQPRCYVTTGLREGVSANEYTIIQLHEQAHRQRFDPLKKLLFAFFGSFFPRVIAERLNAAMELAMEQCADEAVLNTGKEASIIAKTLIKVTRLTMAHTPKQASVQPACGFLTPQLDERVAYLMREQKGRAFPVVIAPCLFALITVACLSSVDTLHHVIEQFFTH